MFLVLVREIRGKCVLALALLRVERKKENLKCFKAFRQNAFLQKTWLFARKFLFLGNEVLTKLKLQLQGYFCPKLFLLTKKEHFLTFG